MVKIKVTKKFFNCGNNRGLMQTRMIMVLIIVSEILCKLKIVMKVKLNKMAIMIMMRWTDGLHLKETFPQTIGKNSILCQQEHFVTGLPIWHKSDLCQNTTDIPL